MKTIQVYSEPDGLVKAAANYFIELASYSINKNGSFFVVLSGGGTPQPLFEYLAETKTADILDWSQIHFFWGDERSVGPTDPQSNFRQANHSLLETRLIQPGNIHRIRGEIDPVEAANLYQEEILYYLAGSNPSFDLIFLGMGEDGHTASLFPGTKVVSAPENFDLVAANHVPQLDTWRITFTPKLINAANTVIIMVSGKKKAGVLSRILEGPYQPNIYPAQLIDPQNGQLIWLIDEEASANLKA